MQIQDREVKLKKPTVRDMVKISGILKQSYDEQGFFRPDKFLDVIAGDNLPLLMDTITEYEGEKIDWYSVDYEKIQEILKDFFLKYPVLKWIGGIIQVMNTSGD